MGGGIVSDVESRPATSESRPSYTSGPQALKKTLRHTWQGGTKVAILLHRPPGAGCGDLGQPGAACSQVDEDTFLRTQHDYLVVKRRERENAQKMLECALGWSMPDPCTCDFIRNHIS